MGAILRYSVDIEVEKGDPKRLEAALNKKDNRKTATDHIAHVMVPNVSETTEAVPLGAYVHIHDTSSGQCQVCVRESMTEQLPDFD